VGGFEQRGAEPAGGWCWLSGIRGFIRQLEARGTEHGRAREGTEDRLMVYSGIPRTPAATWNDINSADRDNFDAAYVVERDH